ncbi:unnamed protein product [Knipowitschia caucasica]
MATATFHLSEEQFRCCICLEVFTEPASLPCGHSFCKPCIERNWTDATVYKCPFCMHVFPFRPNLTVNYFISEMSRQFKQSVRRKEPKAQKAKPGEVSCGACKQKAKKSCPVCADSYCETHLAPHQDNPDLKGHHLIVPRSRLDGRLCPEHGKALDLFCMSDEKCVCVMCVRYHHGGHQVGPLSEVSGEKKQQLMTRRSEVTSMIKSRKEAIQELSRRVEGPETDEGSKVFSSLREAVDRALDKLVRDQAEAKIQREDLIQSLRKEVDVLEATLEQVDELSRSDDHLQILQNYKKLPATPQMNGRGVANVAPLNSEASLVRALSKLEDEFIRTTREILDRELQRVKAFETVVTLDADTAPAQLVVSQSGAQVNHSIEQRNVQDSVHRFDQFYVLGKQRFSQNVYFEVEVKGKTEWTLGVAKESVNRKGTLILEAQNGVWAIGLKEKKYFACARPDIPLTPKAKPERIGVFVDFREGSVSFYDVANATLIYFFCGLSFMENVKAICSPGNYSYGNFSPLTVCQHAPSERRMTWPAWAT